MKVLLMTDGITPFVVGGMQKHSFNLCRELVVAGNDVTLLHCVPFGTELPNRAKVMEAMQLPEDATLRTICISFPKPGVFPGHYIKESYIYSKLCYNAVKSVLTDYDFIYAKGFCAWHLMHLKTKGEKLPPIGVKFHGYEMFQTPINWRIRMEQWLLKSPVIWNNKNADVVFSYGGKITDLIASIGVERQRIIEIPTGIDLRWIVDRIRTCSGSTRKFLFVGRYERRKGIEELHAVLPELVQHHDMEFHLIGPIPPTKKLKHERIIYHGQMNDAKEIQSIMDQCHVLVTPSHSEGMPNVIMEGMARGMAVVATDVGAVSAVVDDQNGILIPAINQESLRTSLLEVLSWSNTELDTRRNTSLTKIRGFQWDQIAKRTETEISSRIAH
ncbi:MAG: hypothetical protein RLZZ262_1659 [Bacteroidota bacterium]|jgi:glycosyltransferase involved in cell wall biosynthesis